MYLEKYDSYEINVWKSQLLYRLNLLEDALFGLNNLINIKGDDEYLYSIKTQVLIKLGKYEDALTLADYSFKLYHNYGFLYDKAESLFALGDYESSKEICNEILGFQNRIYDNSAKFLIAKIYFAEKDYDGQYLYHESHERRHQRQSVSENQGRKPHHQRCGRRWHPDWHGRR